MSAIVAAITAAGASRRMGRAKALLEWGGQSVLAAMLDTLRVAGAFDPLVICAAGASSIAAEAARCGARCCANPDPVRGRFSSLRIAARETRPGALLLWPVDCPAVSVETLRALVVAAAARPGANISPVYEGRGGHPVLICSESVAEIVSSDEKTMLRDLLDAAPAGRVRIPQSDPAVLDNLNTPEDYRRFLRERVPRSVKDLPAGGRK